MGQKFGTILKKFESKEDKEIRLIIDSLTSLLLLFGTIGSILFGLLSLKFFVIGGFFPTLLSFITIPATFAAVEAYKTGRNIERHKVTIAQKLKKILKKSSNGLEENHVSILKDITEDTYFLQSMIVAWSDNLDNKED